MTRVKVCCIASVAEARLAARYGASAVGLVSEMPSGPGVITEEEIAAIVPEVPPGIATVLLTSETDPSVIAEQQRRTGTSAIQICDALPVGGHEALRSELPDVWLMQVVHVTGPGSVEEARRVAGDVDAVLLDSGQPNRPIKELGGTGRTHDWALSRRIRDTIERPVFLAGGLKPDNVDDAIAAVEPYGVDLCTGVRTDGDLDEAKLRRFMEVVGALAP